MSTIDEIIHTKLEFDSALKKCQSLINLQRMLILRENGIKSQNLLEKYFLNDDFTNKQNNEVINNKIKDIFNINNYEKNIKSEAWQKDMSKMFLGLNDENKGKIENAFFEYNYNNRNKKKEGLLFIRNFFGQMKNIKKGKKFIFNTKKDKQEHDNKNKSKKYVRETKFNKKENEKEINNIVNKIIRKYSPRKKYLTINLNSDYKAFNTLTEMNNKSKNSRNYIHNSASNYNNNIQKKNLFQSTNIKSLKNINTNPQKKLELNTINNYTNIKPNNSQKNIFPKIIHNKYNDNKSLYIYKGFSEKLKEVYEGKIKYKYMTLNTESKKVKKDMEMPELLEHRNVKLFKKNKITFLSPLHFAKIVQMKEIRNKLITEGILDKDVFKIYNKNI